MHRNLLRSIWFTGIIVHCWLIDVHATEAQAPANGHTQHIEGSHEFSLRSNALPTPITFRGHPQAAQVTTIELKGKLPDEDTGDAELILDESTYSFNAFGDAGVAEQKPPRKVSVQLHRKSVAKNECAFEITTADLPLKEHLFLLLQSSPGRHSELLVGSPDSSGAPNIGLEPRELVVLEDQARHDYGAKYNQQLRKKVGLSSNHFRDTHSKQDRLGSIYLQGDLSGTGWVTHDRNQWGYAMSPKSVMLYSTLIGYIPQPVHFKLLDVPDPTKQDRRIYHLEFEKPSDLGDVSLVTWPEALGPHRLVISQDGRVSQVLRLSNTGLSLWEDLQPETEKLPAPERAAITQVSNAVPENFFYGYEIKENHVVSAVLHRDEVSRESLAVLPKFPQLRRLFVTDNEVDAGELAAAISKLRSLRSIRFDDIQVSNALFRTLAELPELTSLSVDNLNAASPVMDEHLELLSRSRTIKQLHLASGKITDASLLSLADMPQLSALDLSSYVPTTKAEEFHRRRPNCKLSINGKAALGISPR